MKKSYLPLLILGLTMSLFRLSAQAVLEADSLALVAFYNTSGGDWDTTNTWLQDSVYKWPGVVVTGNRVTELSIEGFFPTGTIAPEIGNLSALEVLKLIGLEDGPVILDLHGSLPSEIWNLTNLTKLQIKFTSVTGGIPAGISSMTSLQEINFQQTKLGGSIPSELFELPSLVKAYLHESDFTGTVPSTVTGATGLTRLYLYNNKLEGPLPFVNINNTSANIKLTGNFFTFADVKQYHDSLANYNLTDDYQYAQETQVLTPNEDDSVAFAFYAEGGESYAWFYNDNTTPASTDTLYYLPSVALTDTGTYTCKVQSSLVPNFEVRSVFIVDSVIEKPSALDKTTITDIKVYPNPFTDHITITGPSELQSVRIMDITGKSVLILDNLSGTTLSIPVTDINKGIYFMSIECKGSTCIQKVTKR